MGQPILAAAGFLESRPLEFLHFPAIFHPSTHYMWAGAFACQLVMFYRRRLPHWHPDLTDPTFLFVTWPLAGSIPRPRLPQPHSGAPLSAGRAFLVSDREVDKAAFGPVWLRDARVVSVVADALMYGESGRHLYHL